MQKGFKVCLRIILFAGQIFAGAEARTGVDECAEHFSLCLAAAKPMALQQKLTAIRVCNMIARNKCLVSAQNLEGNQADGCRSNCESLRNKLIDQCSKNYQPRDCDYASACFQDQEFLRIHCVSDSQLKLRDCAKICKRLQR